MLQHIEDKSLLDCLSHRVAMGGLIIATENLEGLVLRSCGEGEEAQISLPPALRHRSVQLFDILFVIFSHVLGCFFTKPLAAEYLLKVSRCFTAL